MDLPDGPGLTIDEFRKWYRCSRSTVHRLIANGDLKVVRIGNSRPYIPFYELDRLTKPPADDNEAGLARRDIKPNGPTDGLLVRSSDPLIDHDA